MKKRKAGIVIFVIVLIITAVRIKSMDSHRISGRILAENIAGPGMLRLVEQSMQARARKTSVTEIAVKERKHPQAALTFDDGPDIRYTPLLLDGLKERNVRASFFLLGEKVEQYPELVERMQKEGHLVGNHTYHHPDMSSISDKASFQKELEGVSKLYKEITGKEMTKYYRPPQGKYSTENLKMAKELGYQTYFWSLAYVDWNVDAQPTKEEAFNKLLPRVHPGAIVLLHNTSKTNGKILDELLTKWEEMGYTFKPLSELE